MSKYSGHTPGPWRIKENAGNSPERCDLTIAGDIFLLADINGPGYGHTHPNARLIADSPTLLAQRDALLEALKALCNTTPERRVVDGAWTIARAAIAACEETDNG